MQTFSPVSLKHYYALLLFLVIRPVYVSTVHAQKRFQPGYVVLQSGDTLRGLVEAPTQNTVARGVKFRSNEKTSNEAFYPVRIIKGLRLASGKTYVMRKMLPVLGRDTLRLLLEPLAQGRANLYRSYYRLFTNNLDEVYANQFSLVSYYVETTVHPTRPPYLLQESTFHSDLASLFRDCPSAPDITGRFNEANLVRLLQEYNNCTTRLTQPK
jgi:hypothetical protein